MPLFKSYTQKQEDRRSSIEEADSYLNSHQFGVMQLTAKPFFSLLSPHMERRLSKRLEHFDSSNTTPDALRERDEIRDELLDLVSSIKRKWRLN